MGHMLRDLNLTDAQQQQVKSIMEANKGNLHPLMLQMEQNRLAMLQATSGGAYDQAKVQALAAQQAQLQTAITVQHEALQHQIYTQVLTADQRAKFDQQRTERINRVTEHIQKMTTANQAAPAQ
jgi:Spy/CpxP family protein refolding chaperone